LSGQVYSVAEAADRAVTSGRLLERMWDWLAADESSAAAMPPVRESSSKAAPIDAA
jgi:hypothetical protein